MPEIANTFRYFGFKKETTPGEFETQSHIDIDIAGGNLGTPKEPEMEYESSMGRGKTIHRPGFYSPEGNVEFAVNMKTIGWFSYFALGGYDHIDASAGNDYIETHYIYGDDRVLLPTFTAFFGKDIYEHQVAGCVIDKLELTAEDSFLTLSPDIVAKKDKKAALRTFNQLNIPPDYPLAFYEVNLHAREKSTNPPAWGSSTLLSSKVQKMKLKINNDADAEAGQGLGSRYPYRIPVGAREVTLSFDSLFTSTEWIERLWGNSTGPQDKTGSKELEVRIVIDGGEFGQATIDLPRAIVTSAPVEPKGRDPLMQSVEITAYQDSITLQGITPTKTVYTDILVTIQNEESTGHPERDIKIED